MIKAISVTQKKRGRGRPATGSAPIVPLRLPGELIDEIDTWAETHEAASRSSAIRSLIELGLQRSKKGK